MSYKFKQLTNNNNLAINGIIRQYKVNVGKSVNAGDFVEFVSKVSAGEIGIVSNRLSCLSAYLIDINRIAVTYLDETTYRLAVLAVAEDLQIIANYVIKAGVATAASCCVMKDKIAFITMESGNRPIAVHVGYTILEDARILKTKYSEINDDVRSVSGIPDIIAVNDNEVLCHHIYETLTATDYETVKLISFANDEIQVKGTYSDDISSVSSLTLAVCKIIKVNNTQYLRAKYQKDAIDGEYTLTLVGIAVGDDTIAVSNNISLDIWHAQKDSIFAPIVVLDETHLCVTVGTYSDGVYFYPLSLIDNKLTLGAAMLIEGMPSTYTLAATKITGNRILLITGFHLQILQLSADYKSAELIFSKRFRESYSETGYNIVQFTESSFLMIWYSGTVTKCMGFTIENQDVIIDTITGGPYVQPATSNLSGIGVAASSGSGGDTIDVYCVK